MNRILLGAFFLLVGLGCGRPQFTYDVPVGAPGRQYETVALDPRSDYIFILEGRRQLRDPEVQGLVLSELQAKGFRLVPPEQADLWVNALLLIQDSRLDGGPSANYGSSHGGGFGQGRGGGHGTHSSAAEAEGGHGSGASHSGGGGLAVLTELVARSSLERVWFGIGDVVPSPGDTGHHGNPPLPGTVKRLLEPLPARTPPKP